MSSSVNLNWKERQDEPVRREPSTAMRVSASKLQDVGSVPSFPHIRFVTLNKSD